MFHIININKQHKFQGQIGKIPHIIFRAGLEDLEHTTIQMSSVFHKQIGFGWNQRVTTRSCVHTLRPFGGCCAYRGCECRGCRKPTSLPHTQTTQFSSFAFAIVELAALSHKELITWQSFRCFLLLFVCLFVWSGLFRKGKIRLLKLRLDQVR